MPSARGVTPRQSIRNECERRGQAAVVNGCIDLLEGQELDDGLVSVLGGRAAGYVLGGGEGGRHGHWPRVWAARGLLHNWDEVATAAIIGATRDDSWRVREMAAKVIARHDVSDALQEVVRLRDDPVARVRAAATKAVEILTAHGA